LKTRQHNIKILPHKTIYKELFNQSRAVES